eukprot:TRINITY_DN5640_c0_g1_i1.p1 TRINITY_DN5640_c0_g1~~TRINITY_DN5640_c0_g1_i1.p1  ORF type:complete len:777 (+),score=207.47 TRINITY_DN5640_c0_g1_i1:36-2333(+)
MDDMLKAVQHDKRQKGKQKRNSSTSALTEAPQNGTRDRSSSKCPPAIAPKPKAKANSNQEPPVPNLRNFMPPPRQRKPRPVPAAKPAASSSEQPARRAAPKPPVAAPVERKQTPEEIEAEMMALFMAELGQPAAEPNMTDEEVVESKPKVEAAVPPPKPARRSHAKPAAIVKEDIEQAEPTTPTPITTTHNSPLDNKCKHQQHPEAEEYTIKPPSMPLPQFGDISVVAEGGELELSTIPADQTVGELESTRYDNLMPDGMVSSAPGNSMRNRSHTVSADSFHRSKPAATSSIRDRCISISDSEPAKRMQDQLLAVIQAEPRSPSCGDVTALLDQQDVLVTDAERSQLLGQSFGSPTRCNNVFSMPGTPTSAPPAMYNANRSIRKGLAGTYYTPQKQKSLHLKKPVFVDATIDRGQAEQRLISRKAVVARSSALIRAADSPDLRVETLYKTQSYQFESDVYKKRLALPEELPQASATRDMTVSGLVLPVAFRHIDDLEDPDWITYDVYLTLLCGTQGWISSLQTITHEDDKVFFDSEITFSNVASDFDIEAKLYACRRKEKPASRFATPQKAKKAVNKLFKRAMTKMNLTPSSTPQDPLKHIKFQPVAQCTLKADSILATALPLTLAVEYASPFSRLAYHLAPGSLNFPNFESKLTFKDAGNWVRGLAVLKDGYFTFDPDLSSSEHDHKIAFDLANFLPHQATASRPSIRNCGRKHTFDVVGPARPAQETFDINWRFRADSKEVLEQWLAVINDNLNRISAWHIEE